MKKKILITFGILVVCGIGYFTYTNKRIEGIWINHYDISPAIDYNYPGRDVLLIENQEFQSFNHNANGGLIEKKYFLAGKSLRLWPKDSMDFSIPKAIINDDSLIFTFNGDQQRIYKKVPDSLKNSKDFNFDFANKAFQLESERRIDTTYFDADLTYDRRKDHPYRKWYTGGWKTIEIDYFDFLIFANGTPVIINEKNDEVLLYVLGEKKNLIEVKLDEIELDSIDLISIEHYKKYYVDR